MKQIVFFLFLVPTAIFAQVLMSDNFDSYTAGPVSTDDTGATAGASGYYTFLSSGTGTSTNLGTNLAEFANDTGSMGLKLSGPDGTNGGLFVWKDGLDTAWGGRTAGNDIIEASVDFTLLSEGSQNLFVVAIYNSDFTKILAGIRVNVEDKTVRPLAYFDNNGTLGNFFFGSVGSLTLNTATTIVFSYNKTTGEVVVQVGSEPAASIQGAAAGLDPVELDFLSSRLSTNASSNQGVFDNLSVEAVATLGVEDIQENARESFTFYPNPVQDVLQIQLNDGFDAANTRVSITDMNGKLVSNQIYQESMDVSSLEKGLYLLTITDGTNTQTEKLIKK